MSQNNSVIAAAIISLMTNYPTFGFLVICIVFLSFFILFGIYLFAFYQGREIQIFGMRIGPKPKLDSPESSSESDFNDADREIIRTINNLFL